MLKIKVSLLLAGATLAVCLVPCAFAALKMTAPDDVCRSLNGIGLGTRGWKVHDGATYGCSSPYKDIGSAFPLPNNLAFYAKGGKNAVSQVKLVLNVNDRSDASNAHAQLLKASETLCVKFAGKPLPQPLKQAIKRGANRAAKLNASRVEVMREDWPTGKGYEVQVIIR